MRIAAYFILAGVGVVGFAYWASHNPVRYLLVFAVGMVAVGLYWLYLTLAS